LCLPHKNEEPETFGKWVGEVIWGVVWCGANSRGKLSKWRFLSAEISLEWEISQGAGKRWLLYVDFILFVGGIEIPDVVGRDFGGWCGRRWVCHVACGRGFN